MMTMKLKMTKTAAFTICEICRIDPTVVPLLSLPYGTCMEKDETGEWIEIEDDETERS